MIHNYDDNDDGTETPINRHYAEEKEDKSGLIRRIGGFLTASALVGGVFLFTNQSYDTDRFKESHTYSSAPAQQAERKVVSLPGDIFCTPSDEDKSDYDFGYNVNDDWKDRLASIEDLARNNEPLTRALLADLCAIAEDADHNSIKWLIAEMFQSFGRNRDFSDTRPYRQKLMKEARLTIKTQVDFGYQAEDIWYARLGALENLEVGDEIPDDLISDLTKIAVMDDDGRIRRQARNLLKDHLSPAEIEILRKVAANEY